MPDNPMARMTLPNGLEIAYIDKATARYVYDEVFVDRVYVQHGIRVKPGDVVLDVGANIGLFSRFITREVPGLHVYAFEPVPVIFEHLEANLAGIPGIEKLYNVGLGDRPGSVDVTFYPKVSADSAAVPFDWEYKVAKYVEHYKEVVCKDLPIARIVPKCLRKRVVKAFLKRYYTGTPVSCQIRTLSEIIAEDALERVDFLKLDAENYEGPIMRGIAKEDWPKIRQIGMEVHTHIKGGQGLLEEMSALLESKGFQTHVGGMDRETLLGVYMLYATREGAA